MISDVVVWLFIFIFICAINQRGLQPYFFRRALRIFGARLRKFHNFFYPILFLIKLQTLIAAGRVVGETGENLNP